MKKRYVRFILLAVIILAIGATVLLFWLGGKNKKDSDEKADNSLQSETSQKNEAGQHTKSSITPNTEEFNKENTSTGGRVEASTSETTSARSDEKRKSHGSYYESYWEDKEKAKEEDPEAVEEYQSNLITIMKTAKERKDPECVITFEDVDSDTSLLYKVKSAYVSDKIDSIEVNTEEVLSPYLDNSGGTLKLQDGYQYAVVDLEVKNSTDKTINDVPMNCFTYCLVDDEGTEHTSEFSYGTAQPGRNPQHRYFISEMAAGETMSTTVIFVIPKDEQFDTYSHFIKIDPTGVGDNTLGWVDMICLDSVIGQ